MVSEPDIGRCANEDVGPQEGWIVRSHIGWRGEQNIPYNKGVETLRENPEEETQRGQYTLAVGFVYYKWYQSQILAGVPTRTLVPKRDGL